MEMTPRLGLPLLIAGQVQKELFHNEALLLADLLIGGSVDEAPVAAPPPTPVAGSLYRVAAGATGLFAGHDDKLAGWTPAGWRFIVPVEGMRLTVRPSGTEMIYRDGGWSIGSLRANEIRVDGTKIIGAQRPAIADAVGGGVVDGEVRIAVNQILAALRGHGLIAV